MTPILPESYTMNITTELEFAQEIVRRLNILLEKHPDIRNDIEELLETRVNCSTETSKHPTLTVWRELGVPQLGALGLLNGLLDTGWRWRIAASSNNDHLERFLLVSFTA